MALSGVSMTFTDGNLGVAIPGPGGAQAKVGVSLGGDELVPASFGTPAALAATLLGGPLCDAGAQMSDVAGAPVIAVPCPVVTNGSIGAFTQVGSGAGVVSATAAPHQTVLVKCTTAGAVGTAKFRFSVNGGAYGTTYTSTATSWVKRVPGTFLVLTCSGTFRENDIYTYNTDGTTSATEGATGVISVASSPVDAYDLLVTIYAGAATRAAMQFTYSLDGGTTVSSPISGAATYVIAGSGLVLAFTEAVYVTGDTYESICVAPATDNTNIGLAIDALAASALQWEGVHIVGTPSSAANAATLATVVDGKMTSLATSKKYRWALTECPGLTNGVDTDAVVAAAFLSFSSAKGRIFIGLDWCDLVSPLTALTLKRSVAWVASARLAASKLSESPAKVALGALPNVRAIYRDEAAAPGMADARFIVMRNRIDEGKAGYYFEKHPTMAPLGSDYSKIPNVRVVNRAAQIAMAAFTNEVSMDVRIDPDTGYIDERDAQRIDNSVTGQLKAQLMGARGSRLDECSDIQAQIGRQDNLLSSETATAVIRIWPKAYLTFIDVSIGFVNPALQA